jgi:hypothetical protein
VEKPARDFLPRADLGERAVFLRVEIDLERFLAGVQFFAVHKFLAATIHKFHRMSNVLRFGFSQNKDSL